MHRTRLVSMLASFSEKEIVLFEKWIKSSFIKTNKNESALLKLLLRSYPDFKSEQIEKSKIFKSIFPGDSYNDARIRNLVSDMQKKTEQFLSWSAFYQNQTLQQQLLLTELNNRKLHSLFETRLKEAQQAIESSKANLFSTTLSRFLIDEEELMHHYTVNFGQAYKVPKKYDPGKVLRSLTDFYLTHTLSFYHKLLDDQKKFGKGPGLFENFEVLAEELYAKTGQDNILTHIYLKIIRLLQTGDKKYFFEIKKEIKTKEFRALSDYDQRGITIVLCNYCSREYQNGYGEFLKEILEMSAISLKKRFCFSGKHISHIFFSNYVNYLIADDKINEAKKFIAGYGDAIQPNMQESAFNFAMAYVFLAEKKMPQALAALTKVTNDTPQRGISIKSFLLRVYFEKDEMSQTPFLIDALRHNLANKAFLGEHFVVAGKQFLHYYIILDKIKQGKFKAPSRMLDKITGELLQPGPIAGRDWLQRTAKELAKKIK